jgi:LytS/YehU family sensor histidine kinase
MPRVRRPRRPAPVLELLAATLPELRRGLTERAARTVAYELFEKLGCGAVAVTDTRRVLAHVGAGSDHHAAGDQPIRPVYDALAQLSAQLQPSELASATTTALQAQMEPHFVFNALNTIAAFIRTDPDRARQLVLAFADHLRSKLARPGEFITLDEELRHVRSYLSLEEARFGVQLEVTIDADPAARRVRLPPLLVQPLVENAIKHGKTDRPLHLLVRARVRRGRLRVTVRDDGRGIARDVLDRVLEPGVSDDGGMGLGLANVDGRLNAHYGAGVRLRSFPFGTVVRLDVPAADADS